MEEGNRRALVVAGSDEIRNELTHTLAMQAFDVATAASARQGIRLTSTFRPDIIAIDLDLPDFDGIEVCRRIREFSNAYVIMIATAPNEADRLMALETGADDFLGIPFSVREFQARVTAMFRRPRNSSASATTAAMAADRLAYGVIELDTVGRIVTIRGEEVQLTKTEFDILAILLSNPRRVWTREVLLEAVWGDKWVADMHLVEVHVGNLRRKLFAQGHQQLVHTVRGVGYRMSTLT